MSSLKCRPRAKNSTAAKPAASPLAPRTSPTAEPPGRQDPPDHQLLGLPEVMRRLRMSRSSIYAAIAAGDFPRPIRVGSRSVRWFAREIDAWVESRPRAGGAG